MDALQHVFRLRAHVWLVLSNDSQFYGSEWKDEFDATALHWVAQSDDRIVASARMTIHDELNSIPDYVFFKDRVYRVALPIASISRLVVHPDFRGLGIGSGLDAVRLQTARDMGCKTMTVVASKLSGLERLRALERHGFRAIAPLYSLRDWDRDWVTPMILHLYDKTEN